jgi:hypothetical protein
MVDLSIVFLYVYQRVLKSSGHEIPLLLAVTPEFDLGPRSELPSGSPLPSSRRVVSPTFK